MEKEEVKKRRVQVRTPKQPLTKADIEKKIRELEKQKKLVDLDIEKLKIELEFTE